MKMDRLKIEIIKFVINEDKETDLSDFGNLIGIYVANNVCNANGFSLEDFLDGISHGIELVEEYDFKIITEKKYNKKV